MANHIQVLSDKTINQIAAGEVIEGPSSVIKELFENAIDAGATSIKIEILGGGHFKICVRDNGCGMARDDAFLAFERHATSKIRQVGDLLKLSSMGFRGEALASIAACAKVELITCQKGQDIGTKVMIHGGKMFRQEDVSRDHGTSIEVASLFYNVPARKAFQKSKGQSTSEIVKIVAKLALAHPSVAVELVSHDDTLLKTSGSKEHVIEEVLGNTFSHQMKPVSYEFEKMKLEGVISTPLNTRKNRTGQYLFINERPIHSPIISKWVQEAYGTRLSTKEYPLFCLWIDIPSDQVDVNVHPQKSEVRFKCEPLIEKLVYEAISTSFEAKCDFSFKAPEIKTETKLKEPTISYEIGLTRSVPLVPPKPKPYQPSIEVTKTIESKPAFEVMGTFDQFAIVLFEEGSKLFDQGESEKQIAFFDLAQVAKRLLFDDVKASLKEKKAFETQQLLFSETLSFSSAEAKQIEMNKEALNRLGIGIREFGENTFVIDALADHIELDQLRDLVLQVSEKMSEEELAKKIISSHNPKKQYTHQEIVSLIERVMQSSDPIYTPSGKQMVKMMTKEMLGEWIGKA